MRSQGQGQTTLDVGRYDPLNIFRTCLIEIKYCDLSPKYIQDMVFRFQ